MSAFERTIIQQTSKMTTYKKFVTTGGGYFENTLNIGENCTQGKQQAFFFQIQYVTCYIFYILKVKIVSFIIFMTTNMAANIMFVVCIITLF